MGYDLATITENPDQLEAFLNTIIENSRKYIDWDTRNGVQSYHARALPADQYLITISCVFQDDIIDSNLQQIRKMTRALNNRIPEDRLKEIEGMSGEEKEKAFTDLSRDLFAVCNGELTDEEKGEAGLDHGQQQVQIVGAAEDAPVPGGRDSNQKEERLSTYAEHLAAGVIQNRGHKAEEEILPDRKLVFKSLDDVINFAGLLARDMLFSSSLFKSEDQYVLLVRFDDCKSDSDAVAFILTAEEYGGQCSPVHYDDAYMLEHGRELIGDNALEILASM